MEHIPSHHEHDEAAFESPVEETQTSIETGSGFEATITSRTEALASKKTSVPKVQRLITMLGLSLAAMAPQAANAQEQHAPDPSYARESALVHTEKDADTYQEALETTIGEFLKVEQAVLPTDASAMHRIAYTKRHAGQILLDYSAALDKAEQHSLSENRTFSADNSALESRLASIVEHELGRRLKQDVRNNPEAFIAALKMDETAEAPVRADFMKDYPEIYAILTEVRHENPALEDSYTRDLAETIEYFDPETRESLDKGAHE